MGKDVILITGGAGFIGSNLVRYLDSAGYSLRILDNFSAGRASDLQDLPVAIHSGDIRNRQEVDSAVAGARQVIHLAAHTGVLDSIQDPETNMDINLRGTLHLLQAAVRHGVDRFIFASTGGAIVGEVEPPVHEDMVPRPISPYGASKLAGEGYCAAFWGSYGLKTVALRFTNVYGPYSYNKGSVIAKFFRRVLAGEDLIIYGDGEQTRDFVYVGDIARAIAAALESPLPYGQPIQLGTGSETSINALVAAMQGVVQEVPFPPVRHVPAPPGEVRRNFVSLQRAEHYLDFAPQVSLETGLELTWAWFRQHWPCP